MPRTTLRQRLWIYAFIILTFCSLPLGIHLLRHPDPAKVDAEQYNAFSTYLGSLNRQSYRLEPMHGRCDNIQNIFVTDKTISALARPAMLGHPTYPRWFVVYNEFLFRNLLSSELDPTRIHMPPAAAAVKVSLYRPSQESRQEDMRVSFSNVGFRNDLSEGFFYAEVSCGPMHSREYVYLGRDLKHGNGWYVGDIDSVPRYK